MKGRSKGGAELDTRAEHVWEVRDGNIVRFENTVGQETLGRRLELSEGAECA